MFATLKMMSNCTNEEYKTKTLEELCELYKSTENPILINKIIGAMFCKVHPMVLKIQEKYYTITNEQKVEQCLFHLVRCIKRYNSANKVKFSSFYYLLLANEMKSLLSAENSYKRAAFHNITKNNHEVMDWYLKNAPDQEVCQQDLDFLTNLQSSSYLSQEEKAYCKYILEGTVRSKDLAQAYVKDKMDLEPLNAKKSSKKKKTSTNPIASNLPLNPMEEARQQRLKEKHQQKRVKLIKDSIKSKYSNYRNLIFG